jgi:hypothetical protein
MAFVNYTHRTRVATRKLSPWNGLTKPTPNLSEQAHKLHASTTPTILTTRKKKQDLPRAVALKAHSSARTHARPHRKVCTSAQRTHILPAND